MGSCLSKTSQHAPSDTPSVQDHASKDEKKCHDPELCRCANTAWMLHYLKNGVCEEELKNFDWKKCVGQTKKEIPLSKMYVGRKKNDTHSELGTIRPLTGGSADEIVEAIAFHEGKVLCSGSKEYVAAEFESAVGFSPVPVKLPKGQTLVPGLIEPHVHIVLGAVMHMENPSGEGTGPIWKDLGPFGGQDGQDLREGYNKEWLEQQLAIAAGERKRPHDWVLGQGLDPSLMTPYEVREHGLNKIQEFSPNTMDEIGPDAPLLLLSASLHTGYVNKEALELIYQAIPDTEKPRWDVFYHRIRAQKGLQGLEDLKMGFRAIPKEQVEEMCNPEALCKALTNVFKKANERGVTMLYDAAMSTDQMNILELYFENLENAPVRIGFAELCAEYEADKVNIPPAPSHLPKLLGPFFQAGIKLVPDGSNQGLTGYQSKSYCCEPGGCGIFDYDTDDFFEIARKIKDQGWQMMIHANGNKANALTWDVYKDLYEKESEKGKESFKAKRHRIEHFSLPKKKNLKDMGNYGISASFTIGHIGYWGRVFNCAIFEEKAQKLLPCQSARKAGMRITLNSDFPVTPLGPLRMMEQAITRRMEEEAEKDDDGKPVQCPEMGNVLNPAEKLEPSEALQAVTYDAAWQCHADSWVGELVATKMADYVILSADPVTVKKEEEDNMRHNIKPLETWVGGIQVYPRTF